MNKLAFLMAFFIVTGVFISAKATADTVKEEMTIYTVDNQSFFLFADKVTIEYKKNDINDKANKLIKVLETSVNYSTQDDSLFPNVKNGITVSVKDKKATVNFSKDFAEHYNGGSLSERMTIYSIVNTLTSIPEISSVTFTVDGKQDGDLAGHMDLNSIYTFSSEYVCK